MVKPALHAVPAPADKPVRSRLRRITGADAVRAHPHNAVHQRRWIAAIRFLRRTRRGWLVDRATPRIPPEEQNR